MLKMRKKKPFVVYNSKKTQRIYEQLHPGIDQ